MPRQGNVPARCVVAREKAEKKGSSSPDTDLTQEIILGPREAGHFHGHLWPHPMHHLPSLAAAVTARRSGNPTAMIGASETPPTSSRPKSPSGSPCMDHMTPKGAQQQMPAYLMPLLACDDSGHRRMTAHESGQNPPTRRSLTARRVLREGTSLHADIQLTAKAWRVRATPRAVATMIVHARPVRYFHRAVQRSRRR